MEGYSCFQNHPKKFDSGHLSLSDFKYNPIWIENKAFSIKN